MNCLSSALMERAHCLALDGLSQEHFVLPCCVLFSGNMSLFVTHLGFIKENQVSNGLVLVESSSRYFPSRIIPLYVFPDMQTFVDSPFNYYRMLWNSKFNNTSFLTAEALLLLRKYAVQNSRFYKQTSDLIAERSYDGTIEELLIKFI